MSSRSRHPGILVGAVAFFCIGLASYASFIIEEEEQERSMLEAAATTVPQTLLQLRKGMVFQWIVLKKRSVCLFFGIKNEPIGPLSRSILVMVPHLL